MDAGLVVGRPGYMKKVKELCKREGVLVVADERRTGGGALGTLLSWEQEPGFEPDFTVIGAGVAGGIVQVSGLLVHLEASGDAELRSVLESVGSGEVVSASTCGPVVCAAVEAGCRTLASAEMVALREEAQEMGSTWRKGLRSKIPGVDMSVVRSVRGRGLLTAMNIGTFGDRVAGAVATSMAQNGVLVAHEQDVIFLVPPLGISKRDLSKAATVLRNSVAGIAGNCGVYPV
jgi:acetylornithine/succinyldiaminopimelate/putrescine aminotransferase